MSRAGGSVNRVESADAPPAGCLYNAPAAHRPGATVNRLESSSGSGPQERRSGLDRRSAVRRSGTDRRKRARRSSRVTVTDEHRHLKDRRAAQRRGIFDRRSRIGRRLTDRRRDTPAPYSKDDTSRLRLMVKSDPYLITCPICYRQLTPARAEGVAGGDIWEVRCPDCRRTALITGTTALRVLLIYGDATVRDALSVVLERAGHTVLEASDAEKGLTEHAASNVEVVIVDLQLPAMQGVDVIRRIKRKSPETRIIALAGRRQIGVPDTSVTAKRLGAAVVIRKPFTPPAILGALEQVSGGP